MTPAMAEKLYIWTDEGGVLNITNHPSFAPADMRPKKERPPGPGAQPAIVAPPSPGPSAPAEQPKVQMAGGETSQTARLEQTIQGIEKRNEAVKKLQKLLQKLLPGGLPSELPQPELNQ